MLETNGSTHVNQQQAKPLFDRAGLAPEALAQVWLLADADKDGMLSQAEFRCAMHLATLAVQGEPLPRQLPVRLGLLPVPADSLGLGLAIESPEPVLFPLPLLVHALGLDLLL